MTGRCHCGRDLDKHTADERAECKGSGLMSDEQAAPVENPDVHVLTARSPDGQGGVIGVFRYLDDAKSAAELLAVGLLRWFPGQILGAGMDGQIQAVSDLGTVYTIDTTVVIW